jgi:hypothetical protein
MNYEDVIDNLTELRVLFPSPKIPNDTLRAYAWRLQRWDDDVLKAALRELELSERWPTLGQCEQACAKAAARAREEDDWQQRFQERLEQDQRRRLERGDDA